MKAMDAFHGSNGFAETLTLYVFDLLEQDELREIEEHLAACDECSVEVRSLRETASHLPLNLSDVNPHPRVRERLMKRIDADRKARTLEEPLPGVFVKRLAQQEWIKTPFPGVDYKILYVDEETNNITSLLRLQPFANYPAHHHTGVEQCLVLEGTVRIGQIFLESGDFEYANADTRHAAIESDSGCVLMIIANRHDEFV